MVAEEALEAPEIVHTQDQISGFGLHYILITYEALGYIDIFLTAFSNARERDTEAWGGLFHKGDNRFRLWVVPCHLGQKWVSLKLSGWVPDCKACGLVWTAS